MEVTTPQNPSGLIKKPKSKSGKYGRNRKSKRSTLEHNVLSMELKALYFFCRHFGGKEKDWFLGCISILMMAEALRDYFDTDGKIAEEQAAV